MCVFFLQYCCSAIMERTVHIRTYVTIGIFKEDLVFSERIPLRHFIPKQTSITKAVLRWRGCVFLVAFRRTIYIYILGTLFASSYFFLFHVYFLFLLLLLLFVCASRWLLRRN